MTTQDNIIFIKGGSHDDIKRALKKWIDLYDEYLEDGLFFHLYKNGRGKHVIIADPKLDNERFNYLVNYLYYPPGRSVSLRPRVAERESFNKLSKRVNDKSQSLENKRI